MKKAERLEAAKRALEKTLNRTRYNDLKAKHGKVSVVAFPDYTVDNPHQLSNGIGNGFKVKSGAEHPDAIQFPVGNDHKSGLRLIVKTDDLKFMAGKKT